MKHGSKHGLKTTYWLELWPIDKGGVQLRRMMALGSRVNRGHAALVGQWTFADTFAAQAYSLAKFGEQPAMI